MKDRIWNIIDLLINKGPLSTSDISQIFKLSERTIRNDIAEIETLIAQYDLKLARKRNIGISIIGKQKDLYLLITSNDKNSQDEISLNPEERRELILLEILLNKTRFYPDYFQSKYFISNSSLMQDLEKMKVQLKEHNLILKKDKDGMFQVEGNEEDVRNLIASLIISVNSKTDNSRKEKETYLDFINKKSNVIANILQKIEKKFKFTFPKEIYENLMVHLTIMVDRLNKENSIVFADDIKNNIVKRKEYTIAEEISSELIKNFDININEDEKVYIAMHIIDFTLNSHFLLGSATEINGLPVYDIVNEIVDDFIFMVAKVLGVNLQDDFRFINALRLHLVPTVDRLQLRIKLKNPLLEDIKQNYTNLYAISGLINTSVNKFLSLHLGENEIAYITLHLAAAIERVKNKINVFVLCHSGVGTSQLITSRLQSRFPQLMIKDIQSNFINSHEIEGIDLIISTRGHVESNIPVLTVSPFIKESDMDKIQMYIEHFSKKSMSHIFEQELIFIENGEITKEEVIRHNSQVLIDKGYVNDTFTESVFRRESLTSTEVGKGVVLTHGFPDHVNMSKITLTILKNPIIWNTSPVQIIVMMAITKDDIKKNTYRLDWLYKSLNDDNFLKQLLVSSTCETMFRELIEQMNIIDNI